MLSELSEMNLRLQYQNPMGKMFMWLLVLLFAWAPVSFMIVEDAGGVVWAVTVLIGMITTCLTYRGWWPELRSSRRFIWCLGGLALYLVMPVLSYFLVDGSEFAESRVMRQILLLGIPVIIVLFWWLRLRLQTVLILIALNASVFGIYSLWFFTVHHYRVDAVTHAVHFGNVGLFLGVATLALIPVVRHYGWRILAVGAATLGITASVLAGARGGWLAIPFLIVITLIMLTRAFKLKQYVVLGLVGLVVFVLAGLWQTKMVQNRITAAKNNIAQLSDTQALTSVSVRILIWEQAWLEIQEAPIKGAGFSGYRDRIHAGVESGHLSEKMLAFATEPHNEYLYQWVTRGVFGLMVFLLCLLGASWHFSRWLLFGNTSQMVIAHVGLSLITIVAVGGLTITVIDQRAVIRFLGWILAVLMYCVWQYGNENSARKE